MAVYHDEVEIEDFEYDEEDEMYYYPCPCGDRFQVSREELEAGEEVATCPSCSLIVKVIYDPETFQAGQDEVEVGSSKGGSSKEKEVSSE
ncbi:DPH3 homolog [Culex quinquefasciatus]|uniref:DPH3 homolog n=1 Tax=Culex quinquefasciatus TaxID=7176 RepID=UPI0018E2A7E7|nr:DPH3 homolog [Culex quinquefasciatus]